MKLFGNIGSNYPLSGYYNGYVPRAKVSISTTWQWRLYALTLLLVDVVLISVAFRTAYFIRFDLQLSFFYLESILDITFYQSLATAMVVLWIALFALNGLYRRQNLLGGVREYSAVLRASTIGMLIIMIAGFLFPEFILARGWLLISWTLVLVFVVFGRFLLRHGVYLLRRSGYFLSPAVIVGANEEAQSLVEQLMMWRTSGLDVVGFVDDRAPIGKSVVGPLRTLGSIGQLDELIDEYGVEEIIIATSAVNRAEMVSVFKQYGLISGVNLRLSTGFFEVITTGLEVKELANVPLVEVNSVRLTGIDQVFKTILDYVVAALTMLIAGPIMLVLALLIKLDSPGPAIHRRRVMGINGRQFDAFKFRTMHQNGDEILAQHPELQAELAENHKLKEDPRVTRIGRILRKFSLDELPQLFNVFKREMSLVGPRMISPPEMEKYGQWGMNLLTVAPGITGLWQVSGRSDVSYEERVQLDMHYIRNWSILLDLQILFQTLPAVIRSRGAY
jgi:exopolysaccharide biosynthesis polyprenyl glycosylphosphotransferase